MDNSSGSRDANDDPFSAAYDPAPGRVVVLTPNDVRDAEWVTGRAALEAWLAAPVPPAAPDAEEWPVHPTAATPVDVAAWMPPGH